jgi:hypothetical protein
MYKNCKYPKDFPIKKTGRIPTTDKTIKIIYLLRRPSHKDQKLTSERKKKSKQRFAIIYRLSESKSFSLRTVAVFTRLYLMKSTLLSIKKHLLKSVLCFQQVK